MRAKLGKFRQFVSTLLPLEAELLNRVEQFEDQERKRILSTVYVQVTTGNSDIEFDESIDKRKYSDVLKWMQKRLEVLDVDAEYELITIAGLKIQRDEVTPELDRRIRQWLENIRHSSYNFIAFYELLQKYRQYLLIRMHFEPFERIDAYLSEYSNAFAVARKVSDRLHQSTREVVREYISGSESTSVTDRFLLDTFYDDTLDGNNRYAALVGYTFSMFNRKQYDRLALLYEHQQSLFASGAMYSKRLLLNFYSNYSVLYGHLGKGAEAIQYGYLSVKSKNNDYLHYVNNLAALLLRQNRPEECLELLRSAFPEGRNAPGFQQRLGMVTFYLLSLNRTGRFEESERFARNFFKGYKKEIFNHRWHLFISAWFQAMIQQEQFDRIILLAQRNNVIKKEKEFIQRAAYMPYIPVYYSIAAYRLGKVSRQQTRLALEELMSGIRFPEYKRKYISDLLDEIHAFAPALGRFNIPAAQPMS